MTGKQTLLQSHNISIRRCERHELAAVLDIDLACFSGTERLTIIAYRQYYDLFGSHFLVAESDSTVVGYIIYGVSLHNSSEGWILALAISPAYQKMGIGKRLLAEIVKSASSSPVNAIMATVAPYNEISLHIFLRAGFKSAELQAGYFGRGQDRHVMRLELNDSINQ